MLNLQVILQNFRNKYIEIDLLYRNSKRPNEKFDWFQLFTNKVGGNFSKKNLEKKLVQKN